MKIFFYLFLLVLFTGCATGFQSTKPSSHLYSKSSIVDSLEYSFAYNVLLKTGNDRLAQKEKNHKLELVAVKLVNHSNTPVTFTEQNFKFLSGGLPVEYVSLEEYYQKVKIKAWYYFFWCLVNPSFTKTEIKSTSYYSPPQVVHKVIVIPIGIPLGIINYVIAANANDKFKNQLKENKLFNHILQPNEFTYGYIFIKKPADKNLQLLPK